MEISEKRNDPQQIRSVSLGGKHLTDDQCKDIFKTLQTDGYYIVKNMISESIIKAIREHWLSYYLDLPEVKLKNRWDPIFGEKNRICFADDYFQAMYRSYDFLWNDPQHLLTRQLCVDLQREKNRILGKHSEDCLELIPNTTIMQTTTSYYPPGMGWLKAHKDDDLPMSLVHFIVPLTFKGRDFKSGGLYITDRRDNKIDVDSIVCEGDVIFYDGSVSHGVDIIESIVGKNVGRLQTFGIPVLTRSRTMDRINHLKRWQHYIERRILPRILGKPLE